LIVRRFSLQWKYNLIKPLLHQQGLLDVGCGTGSFLKHCQKAGVKVLGVEPSDEARAQAQLHNITVVDSLASLPHKQFDVITLWHVLEHIYDLPQTLSRLREVLDDHGTIFIAVPNWKSPDAGHYQSYWAGYDTPRHVWHFSRDNMIHLLENNGLKLRRVIPMKLDAYYVSLLSEKYKAGGKLTILNSLTGLFRGFQSNQRARHNQNHSSLIYLAQK
jgi:2-polyprenyl-3-methyl-5-hydroxy-6-metoxy-1,4-benzoquinol methylase